MIRHMRDEDVPKILGMHAANGAKYGLPDLLGGNIATARVVADENDEPRMLICGHRTLEMFLVVDHSYASPAWRLEALKAMHEQVRQEIVALGYADAYCFTSPALPRGWQRRLMALGWRRMIWTCFKFLREQ